LTKRIFGQASPSVGTFHFHPAPCQAAVFAGIPLRPGITTNHNLHSGILNRGVRPKNLLLSPASSRTQHAWSCFSELHLHVLENNHFDKFGLCNCDIATLDCRHNLHCTWKVSSSRMVALPSALRLIRKIDMSIVSKCGVGNILEVVSESLHYRCGARDGQSVPIAKPVATRSDGRFSHSFCASSGEYSTVSCCSVSPRFASLWCMSTPSWTVVQTSGFAFNLPP
ncbi:hypothetical protein KCU61_g525, partial [Aureobasidium melanogenum]